MQDKKIPSLAEIAAELGLSQVVVSAVVNNRVGKVRCSPATVERVQKYLTKRGYVPSRHATSLRSAPDKIVGILHVDSIKTHLRDAFNLLISRFGCRNIAMEIMVFPSEKRNEAVRSLISRRISDLIWIDNNGYFKDYCDETVLNYLSNVRTIVYNYHFGSSGDEAFLLKRGISLVGVNRIEDQRRMARLIHNQGHRCLMVPGLDMDAGVANATRTLFEAEGFHIVNCGMKYDADRLVDIMRREKVTAAYCHGDELACNFMADLRERGIEVPRDLSVVGFDGTSLPFRSGLTTLAMPMQAMVDQIEAIVAGTQPDGRHCFNLELVKGRTLGTPPKTGGEVAQSRVTMAERPENMDAFLP